MCKATSYDAFFGYFLVRTQESNSGVSLFDKLQFIALPTFIAFLYHTPNPAHLQAELACSQITVELFTICSPRSLILRYNDGKGKESQNGGMTIWLYLF